MHLRPLLLALVLLAALPVAATAKRAPTDEEARGLHALPLGACSVISSVSDDGRWALLIAAACPGTEPSLLFAGRDDAGGWREVERTTSPAPVCGVDLTRVPEAVVRELAACEQDPETIALAEIRRDVYGRLPAECVTSVERSRRDPAYAAAVVDAAEECGGYNGARQIVRRVGDRWRLVADVSQGIECGVPAARTIPRDLLPGGTCIRLPPRRLFLACADKTGLKAVLRQRPRDCSLVPLDKSPSYVTLLTRLRWSSWGGASARARGSLRPARQYGDERPRPVTITAFRPIDAPCMKQSPHYSRIRIRSARFSQLVRIGDQAPVRVDYRAATWVVKVPLPTDCTRR